MPINSELMNKLSILFESAIDEVIPTVSGISVCKGERDGSNDSFAGVLPFVGEVNGLFLIKTNKDSLLLLTSFMTGSDIESIEEDEMKDCIGELANMICGLTRARSVAKGIHFALSTPFAVKGIESIEFSFKKNAKTLSIPFLSSEISFEAKVILV